MHLQELSWQHVYLDTAPQVMEMKEIKKIGGKTIPTVLELVPLKKKGNKTIIKYTAAEFNKEISDSVFSKRNLQKRR